MLYLRRFAVAHGKIQLRIDLIQRVLLPEQPRHQNNNRLQPEELDVRHSPLQLLLLTTGSKETEKTRDRDRIEPLPQNIFY